MRLVKIKIREREEEDKRVPFPSELHGKELQAEKEVFGYTVKAPPYNIEIYIPASFAVEV